MKIKCPNCGGMKLKEDAWICEACNATITIDDIVIEYGAAELGESVFGEPKLEYDYMSGRLIGFGTYQPKDFMFLDE